MAIHGPLGAGQDCAMAPAPSLHLGVSLVQHGRMQWVAGCFVAAVKQQISTADFPENPRNT